MNKNSIMLAEEPINFRNAENIDKAKFRSHIENTMNQLIEEIIQSHYSNHEKIYYDISFQSKSFDTEIKCKIRLNFNDSFSLYFYEDAHRASLAFNKAIGKLRNILLLKEEAHRRTKIAS